MTTVTEIVFQRTPKVTTVTEIIAKSKLSCETSFKNESPKSIFDDSHTRQARGKPAALPKVTTVTEIVLDHFSKATTVTEIVLDHFQK